LSKPGKDLVDPQDERTKRQPAYLEWDILAARGEPPTRSWALQDWLGMGYTTLLAAKGGMGKSIFAQQLGTALALPHDFIACIENGRRVLGWFGEDDHDELWRRQDAICRRFQVPMDALRGKLLLESMIDTDCCLVGKSSLGAGLIRTNMLHDLRDQIGDTKSQVVILDNVAKMFAGNENDRGEVTAFLTALAWAAQPTRAAVLLISHVAKGMNSEFSGSTAWENAVRSRWWLTDRPPDSPEQSKEETEATDLRYLSKRKVNYSARDICILRYGEGSYAVAEAPAATGTLMSNIRRRHALNVILAGFPKLTAMRLTPTDSAASRDNYLPAMLIAYQFHEGYSRRELADAMRSLMVDNILRREIIGHYPNRTPKYGLVQH
jgi:RecA-family ATPase